jgi:lauroyl/myristoyl acyltransferase
MRERSFSMGAARLAKLCKCPIVSCVCWREDDGTIIFQWGSPILSVGNEIDTMNQLIDAVEEAIAARPTQYVLEVGHERRWNPELGRWQ